MVFSSLVFIFRFMPICLILYFLFPNKYKNMCLFIFSMLFYSYGEPRYIILMISSILVDYLISINIEKYSEKLLLKKILLAISIIYNLGMLCIFKYYDFFIGTFNDIVGSDFSLLNLSLPLGISFYTFQTMSYTIDVYCDRVKAETNLINFATFVTMFPQLIAGPIVKYSDIQKDLQCRSINIDIIQDGVEEFIIGLGKKVILANNFGLVWSYAKEIGFSNISTPMAWLSLLCFSFQIYYDFSGYSTMAIGLGKILGFNFPKNFNFPYISKSIVEFWRRWHITLGSWFKEYVYIPLGGSRCTNIHKYFNLFIVWFLTGLWHGAEVNFIFWGLYFYIFIVLEKTFLHKYLNKHNLIAHIYTIFVLLIGWLIFVTPDINTLCQYMKALFIYKHDIEWIYYLKNSIIILIIGLICSTPLIETIWYKLRKNAIIKTLSLLCIFFISISYLVDSTYNPFLYFRF